MRGGVACFAWPPVAPGLRRLRQVAGGILAAAILATAAAAAELTPFAGTPEAPALVLPDLAGTRHDLAAYRGRVVVVNFWATWCAPCLREFPAMQRARAALAPAGVRFLAVNTGQRRDLVENFVKRQGIDLPVLLDDGRIVSDRWVAKALPVSYVISPDGRVVLGVIGDHAWDRPATLQRLERLARRRASDRDMYYRRSIRLAQNLIMPARAD